MSVSSDTQNMNTISSIQVEILRDPKAYFKYAGSQMRQVSNSVANQELTKIYEVLSRVFGTQSVEQSAVVNDTAYRLSAIAKSSIVEMLIVAERWQDYDNGNVPSPHLESIPIAELDILKIFYANPSNTLEIAGRIAELDLIARIVMTACVTGRSNIENGMFANAILCLQPLVDLCGRKSLAVSLQKLYEMAKRAEDFHPPYIKFVDSLGHNLVEEKLCIAKGIANRHSLLISDTNPLSNSNSLISGDSQDVVSYLTKVLRRAPEQGLCTTLADFFLAFSVVEPGEDSALLHAIEIGLGIVINFFSAEFSNPQQVIESYAMLRSLISESPSFSVLSPSNNWRNQVSVSILRSLDELSVSSRLDEMHKLVGMAVSVGLARKRSDIAHSLNALIVLIDNTFEKNEIAATFSYDIKHFESEIVLSSEHGESELILSWILHANTSNWDAAVISACNYIELKTSVEFWEISRIADVLLEIIESSDDYNRIIALTHSKLGSECREKVQQEALRAYQSEDMRRAATFYMIFIETHPEPSDFWSYLLCSRSCNAIGLNKLAKQYAIEAVSRANESSELTESLDTAAKLSQNSGNFKEAYFLYNRLASLTSPSDWCHYQAAKCLLALGDQTSALRHIEVSCTQSPDNDDFLKAYLDILLGLRLFAKASALLATRLNRFPMDDYYVGIWNKMRTDQDICSDSGSDILYVIGERSVSTDYRVYEHIPFFENLDLHVRYLGIDEMRLHNWLDYKSKVVIVFRASFNPELSEFIAFSKSYGAAIAYDIDDLVFVPKYANKKYVDGIRFLSRKEQDGYHAWVNSNREAMALADIVISSTEALADMAIQEGKPAFVIHNTPPHNMFMQQKSLLAQRNASHKNSVVIAYASGTKTHQKDFKQVSDAIASILAEAPHARLKVIGELDVSEYPELKKVSEQIIVNPAVPHEELLTTLLDVDICIAPLEIGNPYCECKSELKFQHAAVLSIPTVATPTQPFKAIMHNGENGYLANSSEEWYNALSALVNDSSHRHAIGTNAMETLMIQVKDKQSDFKNLYTTLLDIRRVRLCGDYPAPSGFLLHPIRASYIREAWTKEQQSSSKQYDSTVWLLPEFSECSGGISTAMRMINGLIERGELVEIWIYNPSGARQPSEIQQVIADSYGGRMVTVRFLDSILEQYNGRTIVATDFGSAILAKCIPGFKRYCYFVQDHEPEFNPTSFLSEIAYLTYSLPYECICCGPWLFELMTKRYQLSACKFELAYDNQVYFEVRTDRRVARFSNRRIAFYYQPTKARRLSELGLLAFEILADRGVNFHVDFFGENVNLMPKPYSVSYHGLLNHEGLAALYNKAAVGLVFSATNYSIIPREMMACGLPIIEYKGDSSSLSLGGIGVELVEACPYSLADKLSRLMSDYEHWTEYADQCLDNVKLFSWEKSIEDVCSFLG